jgi:hypothetical protein
MQSEPQRGICIVRLYRFPGLLIGVGLALFSAAFSAGGSESAAIAWFGTWPEACREAARTARPILLVSGTPHCHEVPGQW